MFEFRNHLYVCCVAKHTDASKSDTIFCIRNNTVPYPQCRRRCVCNDSVAASVTTRCRVRNAGAAAFATTRRTRQAIPHCQLMKNHKFLLDWLVYWWHTCPQRSGGPAQRALNLPLRQRGEPAPLAYGRQNPSASLVGAALRPQPQGGSHARRKPCRGTHRLHPSR